MTITAAQAEIVRRFVAGESIYGMAEPRMDRPSLGGAMAVESALRAALIEKDRIIVALRGQLDEQDRINAQLARGDAP